MRTIVGLSALLLLVACAPAQEAAGETQEPAVNPTTELEEAPVAAPTLAGDALAPEDGLLTEDDRPDWFKSITRDWSTDWHRHTIDYSELLSGGPPRDGIPSIDQPVFINQQDASEWLAANEPVVVLELNGEARAYPLQILTWHEVVNDTVGGEPVIVTFCPLCNSAVAFGRTLPDGTVAEFGVSGLLRNSDLVMYDRVTESLWQQLTGEGIVGELAGEQLTFLPAAIVSFADFRGAHPAGVVLSQETGYSRSYGRNPYAGYDNMGQSPFLFDGELDGRLLPMERVVALSLNGIDVAYPYGVLSEAGVIQDRLDGREVVVFYQFGTSSALGDAVIAQGADVGAAAVYDPELDGRRLTFSRQDGEFVDQETGSTWNLLGEATAGPSAGVQLSPVVHGNHFWFAWAAFKPETVIFTGE